VTDYTALGNAIKFTLENDPWVGNSANVKTLETHKRGFSIQDEKDARFSPHPISPLLPLCPIPKVNSRNLGRPMRYGKPFRRKLLV
jgi:hypothetical protein